MYFVSIRESDTINNTTIYRFLRVIAYFRENVDFSPGPTPQPPRLG